MAEPEAPKHETTLDTGKQQVGEVYAASLLNAADAAGETQDVLAEFQSLIDDVLNANAQFESILSSPRISHAEKESILDKAFLDIEMNSLEDAYLNIAQEEIKLLDKM